MVVVRYNSPASLSTEPLHSASSLRPLALQAMQKVDESSAVQEWKCRRDSALSHDFSDSSYTSPGSSQSCYTESDAASTAPSSPRTPRRRSETQELNFYSLPLDTVHHKSSSLLQAQMISNSGQEGRLHPDSSEQRSIFLPGPAHLLSSSEQQPSASPVVKSEYDRRNSSSNVSVAEDECSIEHQPSRLIKREHYHSPVPPRFIERESFSRPGPDYSHYHVLRHVIDGHVKKERHMPLPPHRGDGGRKQKNLSHCNKPYPWEQTCWIRYQFEDLKKAWPIVEELFDQKFPDPDFDRTRQGLQGSFYRQNKMLPHLDEVTERYIGLSNGHVALEVVKKREQKKRREGFFTFVNLYPEWAVIYPLGVGRTQTRSTAAS
ncbi:uncharacterized protein PG998_002498 [Apiospora kogelbergensis]|uniref:uncharacterized protein n=1 Tax=Apiospora kogelbergensis TaxID=1337665 RepID=UPI00312F3D3E